MRKLLLFCLLPCIVAIGCSGGASDDGLPSKDKQSASRLDEIAKKTGGDWQKLTPEDKDFLVNEISMGSEQSAKMLLEGKAGKHRATPGGGPSR